MKTLWTEIPAADIDRAAAFYRTVFGLAESEIYEDGVRRVAVLPSANEFGGVSLNQTKGFEAGATGTLTYFNVDEEVDVVLSRVREAGGRIVEGKAARGDSGYFAIFHDSEGNLIGLQSSI